MATPVILKDEDIDRLSQQRPVLRDEDIDRLSSQSLSPKPTILKDEDIDRLGNVALSAASPALSFAKNAVSLLTPGKTHFLNALYPALKAGGIDLQGAEKGIESLAQTAEKKGVPFLPETSTAKWFPAYLGAEMARWYKPEPLVSGIIAGKALGAVAGGIGNIPAVKAGVEKLKATKVPLLGRLGYRGGQPEAYKTAAELAELERMAGRTEAYDVFKKLTKSPAGKALTPEQQRYVGRIFRGEIDLQPEQSRMLNVLTESGREKTDLMLKEIEVNLAFDPRMSTLNNNLGVINKEINKLKTLKDTVYRTGQGFIEKAGNVVKIPKILKSGGISKISDKFIQAEPVMPMPPTASPIPANLLQTGEEVLRTPEQILGLDKISRPINTKLAELVRQRKDVVSKISGVKNSIEESIRKKYDFEYSKQIYQGLLSHPKYQELRQVAIEGRAIMDKWSKALADSGIPSEEAKAVIEENVGKYMARTFTSKIEEKPIAVGGFKPLRMITSYLKHRKDLSEDVLKTLGEIKEPAFPTYLRTRQISTTLANNRLFNKVSANPEWSSQIPMQGWTKMPKSESLGNLRNKWVEPAIAEDINQVAKIYDEAPKLAQKMLSMWKFGKVVMNPPTHVRNMISNSILLDMSGVNHLRQLQLMPSVAREVMGQGKFYQEAKAAGLLRANFYTEEASQFLNRYLKPTPTLWDKILEVGGRPFNKLGELYGLEEDSAKLLKFIDMRLKGAPADVAAKEAEKWLFNYGKVPEFINTIRSSPFGAPFITFTYKAVPRVAETIVNNPLKIYKYVAFFNAWNEAAAKNMGMSKEDLKDEMANLPDYMKFNIPGVPSTLLMPSKDKYGRTKHLNLEYMLPLGQSPEILEKGIVQGGVTNPFFDILSTLDKNRDFRDKEIVKPGMSAGEANMAKAQYIFSQLTPPLVPGGYNWNKLSDALSKRPDFMGRVREPKEVLMDVFLGLKITPVDIGEQKGFKAARQKADVNEIKQEMRSVLGHPGVSDKEKSKAVDTYLKRIMRVLNAK